MIRISLNVILAVFDILVYIQKGIITTKKELIKLDRINHIKVVDIIEFCDKCNFINKSEPLHLTDLADKMVSIYLKDTYNQNLLRDIIFNYIIYCEPNWANRIVYGRTEASIYMSKDEKSCFYEAGLLSDNIDYSIIAWWDRVASFFRKRLEFRRNNIGRIGEILTIQYETKRGIIKPIWKSIDSNLVGYDIESRNNATSMTPLLIEVKTTTKRIDEAQFILSENEWSTALMSNSYVFYLWLINKDRYSLAKLCVNELETMIPVNKLDGKWETVKIPYRSFKGHFEQQSINFEKEKFYEYYDF